MKRFSKKLSTNLLFLILLISFNSINSQRIPIVNSSRPRILINENRFSLLNNLLSDSNTTNREDVLYSELNENWRINMYLNGQNGHDINLCDTINHENWIWTWSENEEAPIKGVTLFTTKLILLLYYTDVNKNLQKERINFITERFIEKIDTFYISMNRGGLAYPPPQSNSGGNYSNRLDYNFEWGLRKMSDFGSILLDWGYNLIDHQGQNSLRKRLVDKLWNLSYTYMQHFVYSEYFGHNTWKNDYFVGGHSLRNDFENMKLVLSLFHSSELSPKQQNALGVRYRKLYRNFYNQFLPVFKYYASDDNDDGILNDNKGNFNWGATYTEYARVFITDYLSLIENATDYNNIFTENSWINSISNQRFYLVKPDNSTLHLGDNINKAYQPDRSIITLFNKFNAPINKWLMNEYINPAYTNSWRKLEELLFRDFSLDSLPPSQIPLPLDWFSRKTGVSVSKTSFDIDATMVTFINSPTNKNNHQHQDNNSFQIYKHGPLFIDSGVYDSYNSSHYLNYYTRTIAHNAITIHDYNETFRLGNNILSNDGGQTIKHILLNINEVLADHSQNFDSSWLKYYKSNNFIYHIADATNSYNSNKVDSYVRKFLYLKPLDRIIIIDYIKQPTLHNQFEVKWNAHFKEKPVILDDSNNVTSPVSSNVISQQNTKIERFRNSNKYKVTNDTGGEATIKTLYPYSNDLKVKLVGTTNNTDPNIGCYYVYKDNDMLGINYNTNGHNPNLTEGAKWRLEVSSLHNNKYSLFVNTIDIGNINDTQNNSKLLYKSYESIGMKWDNNIYIFSGGYGNLYNVSHMIRLNELETGHYYLTAFDLLPNTLYEIKFNTVHYQNAFSNSEGVLNIRFQFNQGSWNTLYINRKMHPILDDPIHGQKKSLTIFPNVIETGNDLTILIDKTIYNNKENKLLILDLNGNLLLQKKYYKKKIILSNIKLNKGVYIIKIINSDFDLEKKLIVK